MRRVKHHNPYGYEVLITTGIMSGCGRRIVLIACYLPPNSTVGRGKGALEHIAGAVTEAKRKFDDPLIVVAGDYNQWKIGDCLEDFPDLSEFQVGNTRGDHSIDRIFSNLGIAERGHGAPARGGPWVRICC